MKLSKYNFFYEKGEQCVVFNTFSNSIVVLEKNEAHELQIMGELTDEELRAYSEQGIIIEDNVRELVCREAMVGASWKNSGMVTLTRQNRMLIPVKITSTTSQNKIAVAAPAQKVPVRAVFLEMEQITKIIDTKLCKVTKNSFFVVSVIDMNYSTC